MPRSARAGASSRWATRVNAPRGSHAARSRAAAVISETIGIPSHLSLPPFRYPALNVSHDQRPSGRIEGRRRAMTKHMTGTRNEWLAARLELLEAEKELTRAQRRAGAAAARAAVGSDRQGVSIRDRRGERLAGRPLPRALAAPRLPLHVRARLQGGVSVLLGDRGRLQRVRRAPANHDVMLWAVSRVPLAKLQAYKRRMGWTFPWASSFGGDFNSDFSVGFTEEHQRAGGIEYNYRREAAWKPREGAESADEGAVAFAAMSGTDVATYTRERPGMSAFALEDGIVYHTYSTYARGVDGLWGMFQWLDRAPKGRNETGVWWRRHDEYNKG